MDTRERASGMANRSYREVMRRRLATYPLASFGEGILAEIKELKDRLHRDFGLMGWENLEAGNIVFCFKKFI